MRVWIVIFGAALLLAPTLATANALEDPPVRKEKPRKSGESRTKKDRGERGDTTDRGRGVRDDRTRRDEHRDPPPAPPTPPQKPITILPGGIAPPRSAPTYFLSPDVGDERVLDCATALVCPLEPEDDYLAWMLVRQTSIPYRGIATAREETGDWSGALDELDVDAWELYAAVGEELPDDDPFDPELVHAAVQRHLAGIRLPRFSCELPVVIQELSRRTGPPPLDSIDEIIADRIADETAWCKDDLLQAREWLGSWGRVARKLYLSPFLFEASFGIELRLDQVGQARVARYPQERVIRDVADRGDWPEVNGR